MANSAVIVFDLDDTLYSKSAVFFQTFHEFAPLSLDAESLYQLYQRHSDYAFELFSQQQISLEESQQLRIQKTFAQLGIQVTEATIEQFIQRYQDHLAHIQLTDEWQTVLNQLKQREFQLAILTNGPTQHQLNKLTQLGVGQWIPLENWFISETLGFKKPDLRCFQHLEKQLMADQFWMIGDDFTNDIQPTHQIGWKSIHFLKQTNTTLPQHQKPTASNPKEVLTIITDYYSLK